MSTDERVCLVCRTANPATAEVCSSCGESLALPAPYVARVVANDALSASAFEVTDTRTGAQFLLVEIDGPVGASQMDKLEKRAREYGRIAAPNTVAVRGLLRTARGRKFARFIVRERLDGGMTLARRMEDKAPIDSDRVTEFADRMLASLVAMQSRTPVFVHGAVSAANVVIVGDRFLLGPPSFEADDVDATDPRRDLVQLTTVLEKIVAHPDFPHRDAWSRWLERAAGSSGSPYRNAAIARQALQGVTQKLRQPGTPAEQEVRRERGRKRREAALHAAAADKAKRKSSARDKPSSEEQRKQLVIRAITASVGFMLAVAVLATRMYTLGH